jgi:ribosomal protein S27E
MASIFLDATIFEFALKILNFKFIKQEHVNTLKARILPRYHLAYLASVSSSYRNRRLPPVSSIIMECGTCGSDDIVLDSRQGYTVCNNCGTIIDERGS